jgi:hypothetical protein
MADPRTPPLGPDDLDALRRVDCVGGRPTKETVAVLLAMIRGATRSLVSARIGG